jgi:hypothetical protein
MPHGEVFPVELKIFMLKRGRNSNYTEILVLSPGSLLVAAGTELSNWDTHWDAGLTLEAVRSIKMLATAAKSIA